MRGSNKEQISSAGESQVVLKVEDFSRYLDSTMLVREIKRQNLDRISKCNKIVFGVSTSELGFKKGK